MAMKGNVVGNRNVQRLFTLLGACSKNHQPLTHVLAEDLAGAEEYKLWTARKEYEFINDKAKKIRRELEEFGVDNLMALSVQQVYSAYPGLQEIKKLVDRTETSITDDSLEALDIVHQEWRDYLLKVARRMLLSKIKKGNISDLIGRKELKSPETGSVTEIVNFINALSTINESNASRENITNFHIANCFKVFTEPVITEVPRRPESLRYDEFDPPFQNVARNIPTGFFCVSSYEYSLLVRPLGA
jgi:hypothetical protein